MENKFANGEDRINNGSTQTNTLSLGDIIMQWFTHLSTKQLEIKRGLLDKVLKGLNLSTSPTVSDATELYNFNAATLAYNLNHDINTQIKRKLMFDKISQLFDQQLANDYIQQLESHEIYQHHEADLFFPYSATIALFPMVSTGINQMGTSCPRPNNLIEFCTCFTSLVMCCSAQLAKACATPEFLVFFNHFASQTYGKNYLEHARIEIENAFYQISYTLNQPLLRSTQPILWNVALFDRYFFEKVFAGLRLGSSHQMNYEPIYALQEFFLNWLSRERQRNLLVSPLVTVNLLTAQNEVVDRQLLNLCCHQLSQGNSFYIHMTDNINSLGQWNNYTPLAETFISSFGGGELNSGSLSIISLNINRLIQHQKLLLYEIEKIQCYLVAYRAIILDFYDAGLLPAANAGWLNLTNLYLTIGLNGIVEGAEFLGIAADNNPKYLQWLKDHLYVITMANKIASTKFQCKFNTELVPAEFLGLKNALWDRWEGLPTNRACYNGYLFPCEGHHLSISDKFNLYGRMINEHLDSGSALQINTESYLNFNGYQKLFKLAAQSGCQHWLTNVKITICNICGHIDKYTRKQCPNCFAFNLSYATFNAGYIQQIDGLNSARRREEKNRFYHPANKI